MVIGLFKKTYIVKKFGQQNIDGGYQSYTHTEIPVKLNVQPLSVNDLQALPEGSRTVKRVKSYGPDKLTSVDDMNNIPGDWLFYNGYWYECKSSVVWDHTPLSHYRSEFVILPENKQEPPPEVTP